ncbi:MAG TPA: DUF4178 domain-containing protein [Bryobacteraceae bacterium]|nr:DUF4178 domain-containing protein [Bryobacteraceae bacterium]
MSSPLVAPPVVKTKSLSCPNCGGPVELRGFGHALTVVCPQCFSVLDASTPELKILQQIEERWRRTPKIPLGTRGKIGGGEFEVIGFQTRSVEEDGETFSWDEYLLFNPYKGFRYVVEYDGHWNFVTPMEAMPHRIALGGRPGVIFEGRRFKHFSGAEAVTTFVLGEFPWRVKTGDKVIDDDFIDPPTVLSAETTDEEVTWSRGEYMTGAEIWKAFALPGPAPRASGVYLNQPSPFKSGGMWTSFGGMLAMVAALAIFFSVFSANRTVFEDHYQFQTGDGREPSFVTPIFDLKGRTASLELTVHANVTNDWAYFNFALINEDTGNAFDFGREVSYYTGSDSDGPWTEGGQTSTAYIPSVPSGRYYLRVEPEMDANAGSFVRASNGKMTRVNRMSYSITLKHDVPDYTWFWIVAGLLMIPPLAHTVRGRNFEVRRWMQSDYPPVQHGGN